LSIPLLKNALKAVQVHAKQRLKLKKPKRGEKSKMENTNKVNMENHSKIFDSLIQTAISENSSYHICASKGFGKSRLLFSMAEALRKYSKVYIFDGSEAWLYGFSKIPTFNVNENDIQLSEIKTVQDIEQYQLKNWNFVKFALESEKDILFRLKTRKPSKRGFFIRSVVNFLDAQQRAERQITANHEPKNNISYIIEEAQDAFNSRSTTRLEAEEFLTVFNEARNQKEAFFTASQRLNDFSKTIRTKQNYILGRINPEDRNQAIRSIEKELNINLAKLPLRTWLFNGETFVSPNWKQNGKPFIINRELRQKWFSQVKQKPKAKKSIAIRYLEFINRMWTGKKSNSEEQNIDRSIYDDDPKETQESTDLEEDQALLEEEDQLW